MSDLYSLFLSRLTVNLGFYLMREIIVYIVLRENIVMDGDTVTFNVTSVERISLDQNPM